MARAVCLLALLAAAACSSSIARREIRPGTFELTGPPEADSFDIMSREARHACPQGYESMSAVEYLDAVHNWRWEIRCRVAEK